MPKRLVVCCDGTWRLSHKRCGGSAHVSLGMPPSEVGSQLFHNLRMARVTFEGQRLLSFCFVVGQTAKSTRMSRCGMRL